MPFAQSDDSSRWEAAFELYHHNKVEEAFVLVRDAGVGPWAAHLKWYRIFEAEWMSQRRSERAELEPWLTLEFIPNELEPLRPEVEARIRRATSDLGGRLGWDHERPVLLAILAEEADAPWATNPYGYCMEMADFDKICLPHHLLTDLDEFEQAVAHEYAHVISATLSEGLAPVWLEEAVSVLSERSFDPEALEAFRSGGEPWLGPDELDGQFDDLSRPDTFEDAPSWMGIENPAADAGPGEDEEWEVWLAYQQAGLIGAYLAGLENERRLGELLRAHAPRSGFLAGLAAQLRGTSRTDHALRRTYGLSEADLFEQTLAWVRE